MTRQHHCSGYLKFISTLELLQMLVLGRKTAVVSLSQGKQSGVLALEDGRIIHASSYDAIEKTVREGNDAAKTLFMWTDGEFHVDFEVRCSERSVEGSFEMLSLTAMVEMDEHESVHFVDEDGVLADGSAADNLSEFQEFARENAPDAAYLSAKTNEEDSGEQALPDNLRRMRNRS